MKNLPTLAIAGTLAALTAFGGATSAVYAQDEGRSGVRTEIHDRMDGRGDRTHRMDRRGGPRRGVAIFALACSERGAERMEGMLTRIGDRLELTDAQKPAFEDLRASVLAAQTDFSDNCQANTDPAAQTIIDRMNSRMALAASHLAGMEAVTPALETFYNTLTDDQKSLLDEGLRGRKGGPRHRDMDRSEVEPSADDSNEG